MRYKFLIPAILTIVMSAATGGRATAQQQVMADKVVAVVGNSVVLYSDLIVTSQQLEDNRRQQGITSDRDPLCEALETMIVQKILYNQAQIDSLSIDASDIAIMVENTLQQEIIERGSPAAVELFYHKPIFDIRADLQERYEEMRYASRMQQTVRGKSTVTSGEVDRFYRQLPKDSLPVIPEQYVYSQILRYPPSTEEAKFRTRERMLEIRERIMNGTKFEVLARMYSEDPGSATRGGEMDATPKEGFVQPFADALGKLKVGQISEVVETEFGYHLIQLLEQKGNMYRCRHILLRPQFSDAELKVSLTTLDSLKREIESGKVTFVDAVKQFSEDKYSKHNGGVVTNLEQLETYNQADASAASTRFLKEELNPEVYNVIRNMKPGDLSAAFPSQDMRGNILSKVIKLDEIIPTHPASLSDDYQRIEQIALRKKQDDDYKKWLKEKVEGMFIRVDPNFRNCKFENPDLLK